MSIKSAKREHIRQLKELLPKLQEKLLPSPPENGHWAEQRWYEGESDVEYSACHRLIYKQDWVNHFLQEARAGEDKYGRKYRIGSLAFRLIDKFDRVKAFCVDADKPQAVEVVKKKLLPKLKEYNIEYIYEYAGRELERLHIWFFCNTTLSTLRPFVEQLFEEAAIDWRQLKLELFPTHKPNNLIRLPGGLHLRAGAANPIMFRQKKGNDAIFIIQSMIDCRLVAETDMLEALKKSINQQIVPLQEHKTLLPYLRRSADKQSINSKGKPFVYVPLDLPLDFINVR